NEGGTRMPLKLNVGASKKVGEANYGSRGASINLELELDANLVSEPSKLQDKIRQLFGLVRTSLAEELNAGNGNGHPDERNGHSSDAGPRNDKNGNGQEKGQQ